MHCSKAKGSNYVEFECFECPWLFRKLACCVALFCRVLPATVKFTACSWILIIRFFLIKQILNFIIVRRNNLTINAGLFLQPFVLKKHASLISLLTRNCRVHCTSYKNSTLCTNCVDLKEGYFFLNKYWIHTFLAIAS